MTPDEIHDYPYQLRRAEKRLAEDTGIGRLMKLILGSCSSDSLVVAF
jgi:hypothetical protein